MKKLILFSIMSIFLLTLVSAADFTPQGDIDLRKVYEIKNATNITANYFFGDGSSITGVAGANTTFNQSLTDSLYSVIKWGYNMTTATYNLYNSVWLSTYNTTYEAKVTDNESWNQSHAESLFVEGTEGDLNVNSSSYWDNMNDINTTQMEDNSGTLNILESWFSSLFDTLFSAKDTNDLTQGSSNFYDNQSWNETIVVDNYIPYTGANQNIVLGNNNFSVGGNDLFVNNNGNKVGIGTATPRATLDVSGSLVTLYNNFVEQNNGGFWLNAFDTYTHGLLRNAGGDLFLRAGSNRIIINGTTGNVEVGANFTADNYCNSTNCYSVDSFFDDTTIGNCSGDGTCTNIIYYSNQSNLAVNKSDYWDNLDSPLSSWLSTYNTTYDAKVSANSSFTQALTDTLYADSSVTGDNKSWNESYADYLYADTKWGYNMTNTINYTSETYSAYDDKWSSTYNATYASSVGNASWNESYASTLYADISAQGNASWNESLATTLYSGIEWDYNQSGYWDNMNTINTTQMEDNAGVLNILVSWLEGLFISDSDESNLNVNSSNYWDNLDSPLDTWLSTYNATYDKWAYNMTDGYEANTDTNASSICSGTTTYLDGEGNCDDISSVYEPISAAHFDATTLNITCFNTACTWFTNATDSCLYWPSGGKDCGAA